MEFAAKLVICAAILHNLCLDHHDNGQDFEDERDRDSQDASHETPVQGNLAQVETRRQQLLQVF